MWRGRNRVERQGKEPDGGDDDDDGDDDGDVWMFPRYEAPV